MLLTQSGIGPCKARKSAQQLLAYASCDVIISTGFAGDLKTNVIGSVLVGHEVFSGHVTTPYTSSAPQPIVCHPDWVKTALSINWMGRTPLRTGRFVSVDRVLTRSSDKHRLHVDSGAAGVDMESAAIGEVARGHGVPFLIVRAISDGADEDLPVDFNLFLTPSEWASGILHIMMTPKSWKGFFAIYRHSKQASRQLTHFFRGFFSTITNKTLSPVAPSGEA